MDVRSHRDVTTYVCTKCQERTFSLRQLFRHFGRIHAHEGGWLCGLGGCGQTYRLYSSFKKHVNRKHSDLFGRGARDPTQHTEQGDVATQMESEEVTHHEDDARETSTDVTLETTSTSGSVDGTNAVVQLSLLLLKWKEGRQLPESTLNEIGNDLIEYLDSFKDSLSSMNVTDLQCLRSKHERENFWKSQFPYVAPVTVNLASSTSTRQTYEYVPICDVIKTLLCSNRHSTSKVTPDAPDLLQDVHDGQHFKDCNFFEGDLKGKIAIQLYFDEFEVCNPIGSKRGRHKLLAGYFTLLNLSPELRSKVESKHLVLLARCKLVSSHGLRCVMQPLIADLKKLETDGITVNDETLKGALLYVCGDNLSSHQIGGFRECFSSGRICRFCMAQKEDINDKWEEKDFVLRSPAAHSRHVRLVESDPSLCGTYGTSGQSCLSDLSSFDATVSLPPDIMHDLFEGVIPFVLKYVLKHLITGGRFTIHFLNARLEQFALHGADKNARLPPLSRQCIFGASSIKGSAMEKWCFFRLLPLLIGHKVEDGNDAYKVYLSLRVAVDTILAPQLSPSTLPLLQVQICDFYQYFRDVFPDVNVIPKMHYLIHYPRLILLYCPLSKLSSLRFEAKHQYFKRMIRKTQNFINVCRSLSLRHQMQQTYHLSQPVSTFTTQGCKNVAFDTLPELVRDRLTCMNLQDTEVCSAQCVTIHERTFRVGYTIVVTAYDDDLPTFAEISAIILANMHLFVHATMLTTQLFDEHLHAYLVERTAQCILIEDAMHLNVFHEYYCVYTVSKKCYISPMYAFFTGKHRFTE